MHVLMCGQNSGRDKEPGPVLPACYNQKKVEPSALIQKMQFMPDEVLFYIFYTMPHDLMQAHASAILYVCAYVCCVVCEVWCVWKRKMVYCVLFLLVIWLV